MEEAEKAHHCLVRVFTTDTLARVIAEGVELVGGPTLPGRAGEWWICEQLLIASVGVSLLSSFHELAHKERLAVGAFRCVGEAIFHEGAGAPLSRVVLRVQMESTPGDLERAERILRRAKDASVVARVLDVPIELQVVATASGSTLAPSEPRSH